MPAKVISASEYAQSLLSLIFQGAPYTTSAPVQSLATSAAGGVNALFVSLHTSSAGLPTGNQSTNEAAYTSYARVSVGRGPLGWTVTANSVSPVATISFPQASGGSETETYFGVGTSGAGTGHLLYWGSISPTIAVSNGVQPQLTTSTAITEL